MGTSGFHKEGVGVHQGFYREGAWFHKEGVGIQGFIEGAGG